MQQQLDVDEGRQVVRQDRLSPRNIEGLDCGFNIRNEKYQAIFSRTLGILWTQDLGQDKKNKQKKQA